MLNILTCKDTKLYFLYQILKFNAMLTQTNDVYRLSCCQYMGHTLEISLCCR